MRTHVDVYGHVVIVIVIGGAIARCGCGWSCGIARYADDLEARSAMHDAAFRHESTAIEADLPKW